MFVYVDGIVITGSDRSLKNNTKTLLHSHFKLKDFDSLTYFLGFKVARSTKGINICQRKYALELIADSGLSATKPVVIPLDQNMKFTSEEYDKLFSTNHDPVLFDPSIFQRLIGKLLYLCMTRPNLSYSVNLLSQFMQHPKQSHMNVALNIVKYVMVAPGMGLFFPSVNSLQLKAYSDSDWDPVL